MFRAVKVQPLACGLPLMKSAFICDYFAAKVQKNATQVYY
jgi:hypothetical protein